MLYLRFAGVQPRLLRQPDHPDDLSGARSISCRRDTSLVCAEILVAHQPAGFRRRSPSTKSQITGTENLPKGSFILAPKHQSFWDTIAFFPYLDDPIYILKRELTWIPFFGWYIHEDANDPGRSRQPRQGAEGGGRCDQGENSRATRGN